MNDHVDRHQSFLRGNTIFWFEWPGEPKVLETTSSQYFSTNYMRYKINFLRECKHLSFLEVDAIVFAGQFLACPKYGMKINKPFYKLMLSILVGMARHAWSIQNKMYAISLQYLMWVMKLVLYMLINTDSFIQVDATFFMGLAKHA